jgi:predicted enzyme related to lactoylglutathione lyase
MSTSILGLRTAIYKVSNIPEAKAWYTSVFQTEPYFDEPFYVGFNIGGYELGLQPEEGHPAPKSDNVIIYWGVNDIHEEYRRFIDAGAASHEEPANVGGEIMVASVMDAWGNVIGLIYNPEFKL